ncbi:MAG: ATP-binding protein, partial [Bacteroidota bacterium]|nr:ATP-binding protein [Bacteroidota bacterium]
GPRRVGKTVMMHHAIERLIDVQKISKAKIAYINIENPLYLHKGLEQLFALARLALNDTDPKGWFVFFDEIQYLKEWEIHLKTIVDSYPNTKFIASGSAAAALKLKSNESGAGRFTEFMLPPLTFHEYISLKGYHGLVDQKEFLWKGNPTFFFTSTNMVELNKHFIDYINFGGYPEVIFSEKMQSNPGRYIKSDIVDKVLLRDLPSLYGIRDVQELNSFFTAIAYNTGNEITLGSFSAKSNVDKDTLKKYIEYLEAAFLIKQIHRIDDYGRKFQRNTTYKLYLTNPSLRSALFSPLKPKEDEVFGHVVETAIYAQWLHRDWNIPSYANWGKGEVDMVFLNKNYQAISAVEIKWSNRFFSHPHELKSLIEFCKKNDITDVISTTIDREGMKTVDGINIYFFPNATYALTVGFNTLVQKMQQ